MNKNASPSFLLDKFFFSAFFYSEYVYRNIELHQKELIEYVASAKQVLNQLFATEYNTKKINSDLFLDCLVDMYAFMNSEMLKCNIFSGSIQNQLINKTHNDKEEFYSIVDYIYDIIVTDPVLKKIIHRLTQKSLEEGIYITHIDKYRSSYDFKQLLNNNHTYLGRHLFFKKEDIFLEGTNYILCDPNINDDTDKEDLRMMIAEDKNYNILFNYSEKKPDSESFKEEINDILKEKSIKIYIDINNREYNLKESIEKIEIILAACEYNKKSHLHMDQSLYKALTKIFFSKGILRTALEEMYNKLLGILIWDEVTYNHINIQDAYIKLINKYNIKKYIQKDGVCKTNKLCTKECFRDSACKSQAQILYEVSNSSIINKKIQTSKDIQCLKSNP